MDAFAHELYSSLTKPQREVWDADTRFKLLCSGRRFGKTYLCISRLVAWAIEKPGSLNWYVTQNYKSAKQIAWRQLRAMVPQEMFAKKNEAELSVELTNGSVIALKGAENADALRGVSLSSLIVDEAAYVKQEAWEMVLRPALSDQEVRHGLSQHLQGSTGFMISGRQRRKRGTGARTVTPQSKAATSRLKK